MPHFETGHKILDILEHIWPYVTGMTVTLLAAMKLWWSDRKETKKRINENAEAIRAISSNMVSHDDLHACREDVRDVDDENLIRVLDRIEENAKDNARQHLDIMNQIIALHIGFW